MRKSESNERNGLHFYLLHDMMQLPHKMKFAEDEKTFVYGKAMFLFGMVFEMNRLGMN